MVRQFNDLMLSGSLWKLSVVPLVILLVVQPLVVLVHELGHASVALLVTDEPVTVTIGHRREKPPQLRIGRLSFRFAHWTSRWQALRAPVGTPFRGGTADLRAFGITPGRWIAVVAAGPAASLLLGAACAVAAARAEGLAALALWGIAATSVLMGLTNLVPRGERDGRKIVATIQAARWVPGGATALSASQLDAVLAAVTAYSVAVAKAPDVVREIAHWIASVHANDEQVTPPEDMRSVVHAVHAGVVVRSREDAPREPSRDVAAALAGGASDPLAAAALDRHADALATSESCGAEAAALRYWLVVTAQSRRAALESLRWFDIGRALAGVFAARSSQAPVAVAP